MVSEHSLDPLGDTHVERLDLPVRVFNRIWRARLYTARELAACEPAALRALGLREEDLDGIRTALLPYGVSGPLTNPDRAHGPGSGLSKNPATPGNPPPGGTHEPEDELFRDPATPESPPPDPAH
ncbi:hypothetical protein EDD29_3180 [Actinocorallia herbida]|uniref:Uncharacterized protein n=1 Tax=Actinocorallia herbida TaxID=58109 RepID=A0A3N1CWI8_9ACTN|nr:hypothetical protein [Actinocorallia herbida]ROO85634.1 hypothetical protein EDD29_3180 [Actinocorallia herbida]